MRIKRFVLLAVMSLVAVSAMGQKYYTLAECDNDPLVFTVENGVIKRISYTSSI